MAGATVTTYPALAAGKPQSTLNMFFSVYFCKPCSKRWSPLYVVPILVAFVLKESFTNLKSLLLHIQSVSLINNRLLKKST